MFEQYQQHKKQEEQMKEDKIINEMKKYHKKVPNEEIQRISQRSTRLMSLSAVVALPAFALL